GGIIVVLFGLFQLGVFGSSVLGQERRLPFRLNQLAMNPLLALVLGFTFSFAWTPCVGPALASVLLMASSATSQGTGFLLIGVYTLGFVIPFLAVGLFTGSVLDFFKKHQNVVKYTTKAGGVLMIAMGVMMFTGWMN
ncbi:cytochrome c biogenesis protein CcdA, partial [Anaerotignum faecicola]|nr:cytochrome c biogenesis protein CcdA [Anaerotignum faecicola]